MQSGSMMHGGPTIVKSMAARSVSRAVTNDKANGRMRVSYRFQPFLRRLACLCIALGYILLAQSSPVAHAQEVFQFERSWPTFSQPWFFNSPRKITIDSNEHIYITDTQNDNIQKFTKEGVLLTQWGKEGTADGEFESPYGIAVTNDGFVYVTEISSNYRVQKFTASGEWKDSWGSQGSGDGEFESLLGMAADALGNIYVVDSGNHRIQKFDGDGNFITKWGSNGSGNGQFMFASGISVSPDGYVYVTDESRHDVQKFELDGTYVTKWGSEGSSNGDFLRPMGIFATELAVFVVDEDRNDFQLFTSQGGFVARYDALNAPNGNLNEPRDLVLDKQGQIYLLDMSNARIVKFTSVSEGGEYITQWTARSWSGGEFVEPHSIGIDNSGFVYVGERGSHRIQKFTSDGQYVNGWGSYGQGNYQFSTVEGIAFDSSNNMYVADRYNERIQKLTDNGGYTTEWDGSASPNGPIGDVSGIAVYNSDPTDGVVVYASDMTNDRIMKFKADGTYITEWGTQGQGNSQFQTPFGLAVDSTGDVYVAELGNNRIQKFDGDGGYITQWGTYGSADEEFDGPHDVAVDSSDDVYVIEAHNHRVQKFTKTGTHLGTYAEYGHGLGQFNQPEAIEIGPSGLIYATDRYTYRVQAFDPVTLSENPKAVIIAGGGPYAGNNLWDATQFSTNFANGALSVQGFTKDSIYYISADTDLDLDTNGIADDVDADATNANIEYALETWVPEQLNGLPTGDVVVYLCDHGGDTTFRTSGTETLEASVLDGWLDTLEAGITGALTVVYDACESGTFQSELAKSGRTVLTSTSPGESAYFLSSGSISFSNFFWTHIYNGEDIKGSFEFAADAVSQAFSAQTPLANVDGDMNYNEVAHDLDALENVYIGAGTSYYQGRPAISSVSAPQQISGTSTGTLEAFDVIDAEGDEIARVWAVIRPPDYLPTDSENPISGLPSIDLSRTPATDNFSADYSGFSTVGQYQVTIYAMDSNLSVSTPLATTVSVESPLNRRAIIIAGGEQADPLWPAIQNSAERAYAALKFQGFSDDDIALRSPVTFGAGVDGLPSLSNLEYLLTTWGATDTYDLVLYLVGPGQVGGFELSPYETLLPEDLDSWLDSLQTSIDGIVTVVYDADYSGSFVPSLLPPTSKERVVLCSARSDQQARFISGGDISFSSYFWTRALNGTNVRSAFKHAQVAMRFAGHGQFPTFDDNGNGLGNEKDDGQLAATYAIGAGVQLAGDDPIIGSIMTTPSVLTSGTTSTIRVDSVTTTGQIDQVFATIAPPDGVAGDPAVVELLETAPDSGSYEADYGGFTAYGFHTVSVIAIDTDSNTSVPKDAIVMQQDDSAGDAYEDDDALGAATWIAEGDTQTHNIHEDDNLDWIEFYAETGDQVSIETYDLGAEADTQIKIFKGDGSPVELGMLVAEDDDSNPTVGDELGEFFIFRPSDYGLTTDFYYLRVQFSPASAQSPKFGPETYYSVRIFREAGLSISVNFSTLVTDGTNPIDDATVELIPIDDATGTDHQHLTGTESNRYTFLLIPKGTYYLKVNAPGFLEKIIGSTTSPADGNIVVPDYKVGEDEDDAAQFDPVPSVILEPTSGPASPEIRVFPPSYEFGNIGIGVQPTKVFTVKNIADSGANLSGTATVPAPFSIVGDPDFDLGPGDEESITVRFSPTEMSGPFVSDQVDFAANDATKVTVTGSTSQIWLDFDWNGEVLGTYAKPYKTFAQTIAAIAANQIVMVKSSTRENSITLSDAMVLMAPEGTVLIGPSARRRASTAGTEVGDEESELNNLVRGILLSGGVTNVNESENEGVSDVGHADAESDDTTLDNDSLRDGLVFAPVLPYTQDDDGRILAAEEHSLALRLRNDSPLDPSSAWYRIETNWTADATATWRFADGDDASDLWISIEPDSTWYVDDSIEAEVGAEWAQASNIQRFLIETSHSSLETEIEQPASAGSAKSVLSITPGSPTTKGIPEGGVGTPFSIGPEQLYDEPRVAWLPLPLGIEPDEVALYYHHPYGEFAGWYPAENVIGWLAAADLLTIEEGGITYLGFTINHAATVQLMGTDESSR